MTATFTTCVMIEDLATNKVLVQNRKKKYPGYSFPGGHVERGESFYDCAMREVKEETGLDVRNLKYCGAVHWVDRETDERYICYMYKTTEFEGELIADSDEGEHFWFGVKELFETPKEKLSTPSGVYALSPLFHECGRYSEAFIRWSGDEDSWEYSYR